MTDAREGNNWGTNNIHLLLGTRMWVNSKCIHSNLEGKKLIIPKRQRNNKKLHDYDEYFQQRWRKKAKTKRRWRSRSNVSNHILFDEKRRELKKKRSNYLRNTNIHRLDRKELKWRVCCGILFLVVIFVIWMREVDEIKHISLKWNVSLREMEITMTDVHWKALHH